ncbi:MAG: malto-oligosyltrehalose trehalohydrolase [Pirellulales bacterium]|nr:malto-oligosyltrehalose trehalohydrolase [Pirellulales bacterium]
MPRRLPVGAEVQPGGLVHFRVWAPKRKRVEVGVMPTADGAQSDVRLCELTPEPRGYFAGAVPAAPGMLYGFRLDGSGDLRPDPASRFQPQGCAGLSEIIDPHAFKWRSSSPQPLALDRQVMYELHLGTFSPDGTWAGAEAQLAELADLGITVLEIMPVAEFPGRFGWGYDGVFQFAPTRLYGRPDDFRRFVDQAHRCGMTVILDVVYNHFGSFGNVLLEYADEYHTDRYWNDWAAAINFDDEQSGPVREFFRANARYWIEEFRLDGFRFDATQSIHDATDQHILAEVVEEARAAAGKRTLLMVAENEPQNTQLIRPAAESGYGLDYLWNDDLHHAARVRLTGASEAYFSDFRGTASELAAAFQHGFIYQGQYSQWQAAQRGTPSMDLERHHLVSFLENHDQVSNHLTGERLWRLSNPARYRGMTALWLLTPQTPMFFQGQEFAATSPFLFFADHAGVDGDAVANGRAKFLTQFPSLATADAQRLLHRPDDPDVVRRCRIDFRERETHRPAYELHRELLRLRREDPILSDRSTYELHTAVIGEDIVLIRYLTRDRQDRLVVANLGTELAFRPAAQPLLAPVPGTRWEQVFTSGDVRFGGSSSGPLLRDDGWHFPGETTVLLRLAPEIIAPE